MHRREAMTIERAILDAIRQLAPDDIKGATGRSMSHFYRLGNPTNDLTISLLDAAALDRALKGLGRNLAFTPIFEKIRDSAPGKNPRDPSMMAHEIAARTGELHAIFHRALQDGRVDDAELNELIEATQEIAETGRRALDELTELRANRGLRVVKK